jgi:AAA+ ATPase superfamily predicted ATPase
MVARDPRKPVPFIGRKGPLQRLREIAAQNESAIVIVYGRRRVGKTALIEHAYGGRNPLKIEGIEGREEAYQIESALAQIARFTGDPMHALIRTESHAGKPSWRNVFELLHSIVASGVWTLYFEEVQWLAAYKDSFAGELKFYWDNFFRHNPRLLIVLCGSSPSFMINHVVKSRALYNRSLHEIPLNEFSFAEAAEFLRIENPIRVMDAYLAVGGIPEYLRYLRRGSSVYKSLCEHSFRSGSFFAGEWDKIFVSSFSRDPAYKQAVEFLGKRKFATREEILQNVGLSPGGAASGLLSDLELCGFIERYVPYDAKTSSRLVRYAISDYYLQYYSQFVQPVLSDIRNGDYEEDPTQALNLAELRRWQGYAFERFCRKNHRAISSALGFGAVKYSHGPFFNRSTSKADPGYQIDLVFDRADKTLTLCEIKFSDAPASVAVGREFQSKLRLFDPGRKRRIESVLISAAGTTEELRDGGYFDHILRLDEIV